MINGYERVAELQRVVVTIPTTIAYLEKKKKRTYNEWMQNEIQQDINYCTNRMHEIKMVLGEK